MDESDIPRIKVFDLSDGSLKLLGELLTNESSRSIIITLIEKQMYVNQLAEKLDMRVSLVIHHLKKLGELGLLDIVEKPISKRTKDHKFFRINTDVFLSFTIDESGNKLKRIFKDSVRYMTISIIAFGTWFFTKSSQIVPDPRMRTPQGETVTENILSLDSVGLALLVVIGGLIFEVILLRKKIRSPK